MHFLNDTFLLWQLSTNSAHSWQIPSELLLLCNILHPCFFCCLPVFPAKFTRTYEKKKFALLMHRFFRTTYALTSNVSTAVKQLQLPLLRISTKQLIPPLSRSNYLPHTHTHIFRVVWKSVKSVYIYWNAIFEIILHCSYFYWIAWRARKNCMMSFLLCIIPCPHHEHFVI
jgi:hypothetical protein